MTEIKEEKSDILTKSSKMRNNNVNPTRRARERGKAKELVERKNILRDDPEFQAHAKENQWATRKDRGIGRGESPFDFIRAVYERWIGKMTSNDLKAVDESLWWAIKNRLRHESMPADIKLPTEAEAALADVDDPKVRATIAEIRELDRARKRLERSLTLG